MALPIPSRASTTRSRKAPASAATHAHSSNSGSNRRPAQHAPANCDASDHALYDFCTGCRDPGSGSRPSCTQHWRCCVLLIRCLTGHGWQSTHPSAVAGGWAMECCAGLQQPQGQLASRPPTRPTPPRHRCSSCPETAQQSPDPRAHPGAPTTSLAAIRPKCIWRLVLQVPSGRYRQQATGCLCGSPPGFGPARWLQLSAAGPEPASRTAPDEPPAAPCTPAPRQVCVALPMVSPLAMPQHACSQAQVHHGQAARCHAIQQTQATAGSLASLRIGRTFQTAFAVSSRRAGLAQDRTCISRRQASEASSGA